MSSRTVILCEDKYGEPFLRELTNRLKTEGKISPALGLDMLKFYGACNSKLEKQLRIKASEDTRHLIILVDSDGHDKVSLVARVRQHVPDDLAGITYIIVFDYEIEDWLCSGLGIAINGRTAQIMKKQFGYEKYQLPSYVPRLDFEKLMKCESFRNFVGSL